MGRTSLASRVGLSVELKPAPDGQFSIKATDDRGTVVFARDGYSTAQTARENLRRWVESNYAVETSERRSGPKPKPPAKSENEVSGMASMLSGRADRLESQIADLRIRADSLEMQAKRLRAAADVLNEDGA